MQRANAEDRASRPMSFPALPSARHAVVREARGRAFAFCLRSRLRSRLRFA